MNDPEIVALREKLTSRPRSDDYRQRRRDIDERGLAYGLRPDVKVEPVTANGVRAEWSSTPGATDDATLLYLHGGGYVIGSLDSHHLSRIAIASRCPAKSRKPMSNSTVERPLADQLASVATRRSLSASILWAR
jgi:epsilon-lactone hydrolase